MAPGKFTKADAVSAIYGKTGMSRKEVGRVLDVFVNEVKEALARGHVIELRGFGTFEVKVRKARSNARNPKTGEAVSVRSHGIVSFRPGRELRQDVWNVADGDPGAPPAEAPAPPSPPAEEISAPHD
jgi:integration host factor subunit beta